MWRRWELRFRRRWVLWVVVVLVAELGDGEETKKEQGRESCSRGNGRQ